MPDKWLLFLILILAAISAIVVFSASSTRAFKQFGDSAFYFNRHLIRICFGLGGLLIFMHLRYDKLKYFGFPLLAIALAALVVLAIPGIIEPVKGSRRFISMAGQSLQPSEFAKFALILFLADSVARRGEDLRSLPGYIRRLVIIGLTAGLIIVQPDFSTGMLICLIGIYLLYLGGAKWGHLLITAGLAVPFIMFFGLKHDYQIRRIVQWREGIIHPENVSHQVKQSLIALGDGGFFGVGIGNSYQKEYFLPEPFTDFVFSILGEEFGFIGTTLTVLIFVIIAYRGLVIARRAPNKYGFLLAGAITFSIIIYAFSNLMVVTGLLPVSGLPLPILTYGGSSLVVTMCMTGVLLNISRYEIDKKQIKPSWMVSFASSHSIA